MRSAYQMNCVCRLMCRDVVARRSHNLRGTVRFLLVAATAGFCVSHLRKAVEG